MRRHGSPAAVACVLFGVTLVDAQTSPPTGLRSRTTTAVTYEVRRTTKVDLVGTPLMPRARGEAEIETEASGPARIEASVEDLMPATQCGAEYLTFVLWAVPPQGRAKNLGELRVDDGDAEIDASTDVQTFALIVTAEPYYAVTTPSDVVVMENAVRRETRGRTSIATLTYEIVPRGAYVAAAAGYTLPPPQRREPPDVQQARNAVAIARLAEAGRFEAAGFATAERLLGQVEALVAGRKSQRDIVSQARAAVQAAEEARLRAFERRREEAAAAERAAAAAAERAARQSAEAEAAARRAADEERARAEQIALDAERNRREADAARAAAQADAALADAARAAAQADAARAEALRAAAETDRAVLRARLLKQFSAILETRDTARGLIVNVGDVLFEVGQARLMPPAREKLARFAGIILAHEGLIVQAEGFTDSTGSDAINERLSAQRATSVGDYLVTQGLSRDRVTTRGYGADQPVATNGTREGRQKNRRVELVVSGEIIGTPLGAANR
jgi:outer membrane protein OmpA-like peptidoglycan-associated protein